MDFGMFEVFDGKRYESTCGCIYGAVTGALILACDDHKPYAGTAVTSGEVLNRIRSEVDPFGEVQDVKPASHWMFGKF